jgi:hypothetical protein
MKEVAILRLDADARFRAAKREKAGSAVELGFGLQCIAVGCAARFDQPAATLCSNDSRDVETTVGALLDGEVLSIGLVACDIASLEGEGAMRGQKRRAE